MLIQLSGSLVSDVGCSFSLLGDGTSDQFSFDLLKLPNSIDFTVNPPVAFTIEPTGGNPDFPIISGSLLGTIVTLNNLVPVLSNGQLTKSMNLRFLYTGQ